MGPTPLFPDTVRLRIGWRLEEGGVPRAREAVALADRLISVTRYPGDLVLRARAVAAAGDPARALVTLIETADRLRRGRDRATAREALVVLQSLPPSADTEEECRQLKAMLRGVLR